MDGLDDQVIEAAQHPHPFEAKDGGGHGDETLTYSANPPNPLEGPLQPPQSGVQELSFSGEDLASLRHRLADWAAKERLGEDATEELILAVNELATNSIRYGGGHGRLLLWREQDILMCEVQDAGHIQDPLIGRSRPTPDEDSGRGLWLVHEVCDLVQIRSSPQGTAIRVHKRCAAAEE